MSRTLTKGAAKDEHKGVLTVTLVKGSALVVSGQLYNAENMRNAVEQLHRHRSDTGGPVKSGPTASLVKQSALLAKHPYGRYLSCA